MRGHLYKRYNNSWSYIVDLPRDENGRRHQKTFSIKGTRRDAEKQIVKILADIDSNNIPSGDKTSLGDYLNNWIEDYAPKLRLKSLDRYKGIVQQHLIPGLGHIQITKLSLRQIQDYYNSIKLAPATVRYHHAVLHKALETALSWGLINRNPSHGVILPAKRQPKFEVWDEIEVKRFLSAAGTSPLHAMFQMILTTGLRRSEILALRWRDVQQNRINVSRSIHYMRYFTLIQLTITPSIFQISLDIIK